jgi:hypothetical protein
MASRKRFPHSTQKLKPNMDDPSRGDAMILRARNMPENETCIANLAAGSSTLI